MIRLIFIFVIVLYFFSFSYAEPESTKQELTKEQKRELVKEMGIILPGMTKQEVRDTFGLVEPNIGFLATGQEVWQYNSPEKQNIYFIDDKVERVKYIPPENEKVKGDLKQTKEI